MRPAGSTTDILIDVVGHTSNSTLAALQTEIDAVEAANATQQTQIDSKANSADVYTQPEVDALIETAPKSSGSVQGGGTLSTRVAQFGVVPTVSKSATGKYRLSYPGLFLGCTGIAGANPFVFPIGSITGFFANAYLSLSSVGCPSGDTSLFMETRDPATSALADRGFNFFVYWEEWQAPAAPLTREGGPEITCTLDAGSVPVCE